MNSRPSMGAADGQRDFSFSEHARRALSFLSIEVRGLHSAVYVLASFALLSSFLALLRDRLLASTFGAGRELDLYYAAFRIPDLIFVCLGALVSVYVLIPELARRDSSGQKDYIDTVFVGFSILAVGVGIIVATFTPRLLGMLFPQFAESGLLPTLVSLTRIMLLQPILLGFSNILAAITQTRYRYTLYAASPLFYNFGIIMGVLVFYPLWGISGLAWGIVLGAAMHAGIQIPSIVEDGFFRSIPRLTLPRDMLRTISFSVPRALALSMNQIAFLGLTAFAATLATGSIAVFMFAYNLNSVPLAIIGASYSVAAFPTLALALSNGRKDEFIAHIATAACHVLFWSLPAAALIIVLRAHVVRTVLGSGAFDWTDTRLTAASLALLSVSLVCQGLMLLLIRGYYAAGRTFVPLFVSSCVAFGTIVLTFFFIHAFENPAVLLFAQSLLRLEGVPGSNMLSLALAYTTATFVGTIILTFNFERRFSGFFRQIKDALIQSLVAAFSGGVAAYSMLAILGPLTFSSTLLSVFTRGFTAGAFGLIVAGLAYALLQNREYFETVAEVRGRLWRGSVEAESGMTLVASAEESAEL